VPTRKQRRRQQKGRRHEYEYVYVDDDGNELEPEEIQSLETTPARSPASRNGRTRPRAAAPGPRIQAPSWRRVGKRGAIFAPLMFLTVMFLDSGLELWQVAIQTGWLMAIFLPFSYFLDSFMYRRYQRRLAEPDPRAKR
jgi:hypothetical protein